MTIAPGWPGAAVYAAAGIGWSPSLSEIVTSIMLGDLQFVTAERAARSVPNGVIAASALDGWYTRPRDTTELVDHPSGDGVMASVPRTAARTITIAGFIRGRSVPDVLEAKDRIGRARGTLVVNERARGVSRAAAVRTIGLDFERVSPLHELYQITLLAEDPLRYSTLVSPLANGTVTLVNRGDQAAWPTIDLVGPHSAITITHPGGTWKLTALASGVTRTHDVRNGDVWQGGARVFGTESGPPPMIPPGGAALTVSGIGSGSARATGFEAWL